MLDEKELNAKPSYRDPDAESDLPFLDGNRRRHRLSEFKYTHRDVGISDIRYVF